MYHKICLHCGKEFDTKKKNKIFCCKQCYWDHLKTVDMNETRSVNCEYCGKEFEIKRLKCKKWENKKYCSDECRKKGLSEQVIKTNLELYGVDYPIKIDFFKQKMVQTKIERYGNKSGNIEAIKQSWKNKSKKEIKIIRDKAKKTCLSKYGVEYSSQDENIKKRITKTCIEKGPETAKKTRQTTLKKYNVTCYLQSDECKERNLKKFGVKYPLQSKELYKKKLETQKINKTMISSKDEKFIECILKENFDGVYTQYRSDLYPFPCDFYVKDLNLYIEYQRHWHHGKHPFDSESEEDLNTLSLWKSKEQQSYKDAIHVWTERDPMKRKLAKDNGLYYLEFFNLKEFNNWIQTFNDKNGENHESNQKREN